MIVIIILIVSLLTFFHFVIVWIKIAEDTYPDDYQDEYEYCNDCPYGFCMENPKSDECIKWQKEKPRD